MFLSIIVPHYNLAQELLKRCIDSILALQMPTEEYETIIVDDGSATPPLWIRETYSNTSNIKLIECPHGGPGAARNNGISTAQGKYLMFLDSDDTLHNSDAMQQCLAKLKKENPDILRYKYEEISTGQLSATRSHQKVHFGNTISGAAYMASNNLPGSSCCYFIKKDFIESKNIGYSPEIYHEDDEYTTKAHFLAKTLIDSDALIYNYHIRGNSITRSQSPNDIAKREEDHLAVIKNLCLFRATMLEQSNSIQKRALHRKLTMLAADFIIKSLNNGKEPKEIYAICQNKLATEALYPFIKHNYGIKYNIFRKLANSITGLRILRFLIKTLQKQTKQ